MNNIKRTFSPTFQDRNFQYLEQPRTRPSTRTIGFLLLDNFSLPCFTQALSVLKTANSIQPGSTRVHTFSYSNTEVMSDLAIPIRPDTPLTDVRLAGLDLMIICGGIQTPRTFPAWLSTLLQRLSKLSIALGGLWNGAWYLGQSGLLDGYRCAIHPEQRMALSEHFPNTSVTQENGVFDRDRITAATPAGAFKVMTQWLGIGCGQKLADAVVDLLDGDPSRFRSASSDQHRTLSGPIREIIALMEANLEETLSPEQLAFYAGLSTRQIQRLFKIHLDTTPQRYYLQLRVTEARRLIQHSAMPLIDVAIACGFATGSHFSKVYSDFFSYPPSRETRFELRA
ncbi:GlxA family transcriptional regulator [Pseudomonas vanderleydeniana]|uniref:Helix-turn-helix domain-containing protein n=1 Tax=Pseudomonas vanderleydeniana TaxID=2745495 RepID=A0A9E6PR84_9PSED|nr:helix-turn-helix domain-containing protein [Pseudomonas vanderleydeniana]QXI30571.1 helix-turn-helix domain-containing protein [Pseudomonas vanderleydeniana]